MTLPRKNRGFTVVELVVYAMILLILFAMVSKLFPFTGQTQRGIQRLDLLHALRNCSARISDVVSYGTKIVFPASDNQFHKVLGFLNPRNGLMVVFYDTERKAMVLLDCDKKAKNDPTAVTNLGEGTIQFEVKRRDTNYLSYRLTVIEEKGSDKKRDFVLSNSLNIRNDFR